MESYGGIGFGCCRFGQRELFASSGYGRWRYSAGGNRDSECRRRSGGIHEGIDRGSGREAAGKKVIDWYAGHCPRQVDLGVFYTAHASRPRGTTSERSLVTLNRDRPIHRLTLLDAG